MTPAILIAALALGASGSTQEPEAFLSWSHKQAVEIGKAMRANGRVGGWFDARVIHTEHSYNYESNSGKEGRVSWPIPRSIRDRSQEIASRSRPPSR